MRKTAQFLYMKELVRLHAVAVAVAVVAVVAVAVVDTVAVVVAVVLSSLPYPPGGCHPDVQQFQDLCHPNLSAVA